MLERQLVRDLFPFLSPPKLPLLWVSAPAQTPISLDMPDRSLEFPCLVPRRCSISIYHLCVYLRSSDTLLAQSLNLSLYLKFPLLERPSLYLKRQPHSHPSFALVFSFYFYHLTYLLGSLLMVLLEYKFNESRGFVCFVHFCYLQHLPQYLVHSRHSQNTY